jgi:hypothetical protein
MFVIYVYLIFNFVVVLGKGGREDENGRDEKGDGTATTSGRDEEKGTGPTTAATTTTNASHGRKAAARRREAQTGGRDQTTAN